MMELEIYVELVLLKTTLLPSSHKLLDLEIQISLLMKSKNLQYVLKDAQMESLMNATEILILNQMETVHNHMICI